MSKKQSILSSHKRSKNMSPHATLDLQVGTRFGRNDAPLTIQKKNSKESIEKLKVTEKYNIEIDEDGNIACPAFPYPLIAFDDYEPDPNDRPWEHNFRQSDKILEEDEVDPEQKGSMRWGKLADIVLSQLEYPNIPLVKMGLRAKESDQYWRAIQRDYTIGKNITENLMRMRNVNEKHYFKGCPQDQNYERRVERIINKKEQMLNGLHMQNRRNLGKKRALSPRNELKNELQSVTVAKQNDSPSLDGTQEEDSEAADRITELKALDNGSSVCLTDEEEKKPSESDTERSPLGRKKSKGKKNVVLKRMSFMKMGKAKRFTRKPTSESKGMGSDLDMEDTLPIKGRKSLITFDKVQKSRTNALPSHNLLFQRKTTKFNESPARSFQSNRSASPSEEKVFVVPTFMTFDSPPELSTDKPSLHKLNLTLIPDLKQSSPELVPKSVLTKQSFTRNFSSVNTSKNDFEVTKFCMGPRMQRFKEAFHSLQANTTQPTPLRALSSPQPPLLSSSSNNQSQYLSAVLSAAKRNQPNLSYAPSTGKQTTFDTKNPFMKIDESEKETAVTELTSVEEQAARVGRIKRQLRERLNKVRHMKRILN